MDRRDRFEELFRDGCIIGNVNRIQNNGKPSLVFFLYDLPGFPPDPYAGRQLS